MALDAHLQLTTGSLALDVRLQLGDGITVLRGPTGSGKSTTLRALAGLVPSQGFVKLDGVDLSPLPSEARRVGMVFQSSALFPHLSVRANVAFGARSPVDAQQWLTRLDLGALAERRPSTLSGGEQQLVALDDARRETLRSHLRQLTSELKLITLVVTHSAEEATSLGGAVLSMNAGRLA
jgi:ABC-type Fe3+/spermidine/putrescine transport system ATPase subunit